MVQWPGSAKLSSWRVCVVVQDNKIVSHLTPSKSFDAIHSEKYNASASLWFKHPGCSSTDMHNQVSKIIIERTAAEEKDIEAQRMNGIWRNICD